MTSLITPVHLDRVRRFKQLYSRYQRARDLLAVGAYVPGSDPVLDRAIDVHAPMETFLQQGIEEHANVEQSLIALNALLPEAA